jgi:hypothetical protein
MLGALPAANRMLPRYRYLGYKSEILYLIPGSILLTATNVTEQAALLVTGQERDTSRRDSINVIREVNNRLRI